MATEETVNIKVLIEAQKSAKTLGDLEKSVEDLTGALGKVDESSDEFKALTKSIETASDQALKLALNTDGATATIGELERSVEQLTNSLKGVERGSAEFDILSQKLRDNSRELKNVELSLESLDSEQVASEVGSVAGAVGDVTTSFILLAGEGNETLEQIGQRLETAIGVAVGFKGAIEGIQSGLKLYRNFSTQVKNSAVVLKLQAIAQNGLNTAQALFSKVVGTSSVALKGFRTALISTGIGALVVGIGLLVANFGKLKSLLGGVSEEQKTLNQVQATALEASAKELSAIQKLTKTINTNNISRKDRNEAIKKLQAVYPDLLKNVNLEKASTDEINASIEKYNSLIILRAEAEASATIRTEKLTEKLKNNLDATTGQNTGFLETAEAVFKNIELSDIWGGQLTDQTKLIKLVSDAQAIANGKTAEANKLIDKSINSLDKFDEANAKKVKALENELGLDAESAQAKADKEKRDAENAKKAIARAQERAKAEQQRLLDLGILEEEIFQKGLATDEEREARRLTLQFEAQRKRINELVKDDEKLKALLKTNEEQFYKDLEAIEKKYSDLDKEQKQKLINNAEATATELLVIEQQLALSKLDNTEENGKARAEIEKNIQDLRIRQINETAGVELQNEKLTTDERLKIEKQAQLDIATIKRDAIDKDLQAQKQALDESAKLIEEQQAQIKEALLSLALDTAQQISDAFFEISQANAEREKENRITKLQETFESEVQLLNERVESGLVSQKQADREQQRLEKENAKALEQEERKAFQEAKKRQKAQALINGALAFTNALATTQPLVPLGLIAGAGVLISTGIQISKIESQSYAKGGILNGPSHSAGGIKTAHGELEGGEAVINKRSTAMFKSTLSKINEAGGGRSFATGGILGDQGPAGNGGNSGDLTAVLNRLSENLSQPSRAYVVETDITQSQKRVTSLENNADL